MTAAGSDAGLSLRPVLGRRIGLRIAAAVFGLVAVLVALESALRIYLAVRGWTPNCYAAQLELFRPDPENGYDLRPGFHLRSGRFEITINSLGMRGSEIAVDRPADALRIAVIGESAAFGYLVSDGAEAAKLLEKRLRFVDPKVDVVNAGVPGYSLRQIVRRYRRQVAPLKPQLVIAYLGWNDLPSITSPDPDSAVFEKLPVAPAWERALGASAAYGFLAYRLRGPVRLAPASLERSVATSAGVDRFRRDLDDLAIAVRDSGAALIVCSQAMAARPGVADDLKASLANSEAIIGQIIALGTLLREELEAFARRSNVPFVDAYSQIPATSEFLGDYVHLTEAGEIRLANVWQAAVAAWDARFRVNAEQADATP